MSITTGSASGTDPVTSGPGDSGSASTECSPLPGWPGSHRLAEICASRPQRRPNGMGRGIVCLLVGTVIGEGEPARFTLNAPSWG